MNIAGIERSIAVSNAPSAPAPARLLMTGGTGFLGRAMLRHWLGCSQSKGFFEQITVVSRNPQNFLSRFPEFRDVDWLHFHAGDILAPESLPTQKGVSHILHAAADTTFRSDLSPLNRFRQIVDGTRNVLDLAIGLNASRFLLTSSGAVYGLQPARLEKIGEDYHCMPDPLQSTNTYGVAKRAAEHLCALYGAAFGLQPVIARCFAFVGIDLPLDAHFAIGNFIRDAVHSNEIVISGDGTAERSYLDQRDMARWLHALLVDGRPGRAYNVGSDVPISIEALARLVRDTLRPGIPIRKLGLSDPAYSRHRYIPDITRARSELGLCIEVPLVEAIRYVAGSAQTRANLRNQVNETN